MMSSIQFFTALLPLVARHRRLLATAVVSVVVTAATILSLGLVLRHLIDFGLVLESPTQFTRLTLYCVLCAIILAAAAFCRTFATAQLAERITRSFKQKYFAHTHKLPLATLENLDHGALLEGLSTNIEQLRSFISGNLIVTIRIFLQILGGVALMVMTSIKLTLVIVAAVLLILVPLTVTSRRLKDLTQKVRGVDGRALAFAEETLSAPIFIKAHQLEHHVQEQFKRVLGNKTALLDRRHRVRSGMIAGVIAVVLLGICFTLWYGGNLVLAQAMSAGELTSFLFYGTIVAGSLNNLSDVAGDFAITRSAYEALHTHLSRPPEDYPQPQTNPVFSTLQIEGVSFTYPSRPNTKVLDALDFLAHAGDTIGVVGPSGVGKSSLFHILLGLYPVSRGSVHLNGQALDWSAWRAHRGLFALVPQDTLILNDTIKNNITFGAPEPIAEEQFNDVAALCCITSFVNNFDQGFDTVVGRHGAKLSMGQRQRIGLARALLSPAPILLLDEATSALDTQTERQVIAGLNSYTATKTRIIISHRLAPIQDCNRIVVIDARGQAVLGTHETLQKTSPYYQHMVQRQQSSKEKQ